MNRLAWLAVLASSSLLAAQGDGFQRLVADYKSALSSAEHLEAVTVEFIPRFERGANERAGTEEAVPFLMWIVENGGPHRRATTAAVAGLIEDYRESPALVPLADHLPYLFPILGAEKVGEHLDSLAEVSNEEVQAHARFSRALMVQTQWGRGAREEDRTAAAADLEKVIELTEDAVLEAQAKALSIEARGLRIGEVAPEIFGVDIDGVPFKLSDYRGKVVVIDFWGDW